MEIVKKMNIPAESLFEIITRSVMADIQSQTGENVSEDQLPMFEYIKTFGKNSRATIRIEEFVKNKSYHYRTTTTKNDFLVKYDIAPLTEESCELHYVEQMESYGHMQKLNDAFVGIILSRFKKKRFNEMLKQIEESYANSTA